MAWAYFCETFKEQPAVGVSLILILLNILSSTVVTLVTDGILMLLVTAVGMLLARMRIASFWNECGNKLFVPELVNFVKACS